MMLRLHSLAAGAATLALVLTHVVGAGTAMAQDKSQQPGCTTRNGVSTGAGCTTSGTGSAAGAVENGMPATKHQQDVLRTDDKATQGQNMSATGAGGAQLPATQHQQEVLQKPGTTGDQSNGNSQ
jgi:hypothetical protein